MIDNAIAYVSDLWSSILLLNPLVVGFLLMVGMVLGYILGTLFIGTGKTEQRMVARNYAAGYRRGWSDAREGKHNVRP